MEPETVSTQARKQRRKFFLFAVLLLLILVAGFISLGFREKRIKTEHFTFVFTRTEEKDVKRLAAVLENSYRQVSRDLRTRPSKHLEVYIYPYLWQYIKATGNWGASGSIEGPAKIHFLEQDWSRKENERVAIHEFTHTVVLKLLVDQEVKPLNATQFDKKFLTMPVWLWEAISNYEAGEFRDPKKLSYLKNGSSPGLAELGDRSKGAKIYDVGYTVVEYILQRYGRDKLIELIASYGNLPKVLHITDDQFSKDWYSFVSHKYLN